MAYELRPGGRTTALHMPKGSALGRGAANAKSWKQNRGGRPGSVQSDKVERGRGRVNKGSARL